MKLKIDFKDLNKKKKIIWLNPKPPTCAQFYHDFSSKLSLYLLH